MSPHLMQASDEWAKRPDDQRFWTLDEMHQATSFHRATSTESVIDFADRGAGESSIEVDPYTSDMLLVDRSVDAPIHRSRLTHYSFGQLCRTWEAPASYLRTLPVELAVDCLNEGRRRWQSTAKTTTRQMLYQGTETDGATLRAATSERYVRVWDADIVHRLMDLQADGWVVPPARPSAESGRTRIATEEDVIDYGTESVLNVKVGDTIAPAGLYASDHDMFAFMIHPEVVVDDGESPNGLRRGTMVRQSEVGDCSIWKLDFLFNTVCGNHIVWGAQDVRETRVRHMGSSVQEKWLAMVESISGYASASASEQEAQIRRAKETILGQSREEIVDVLFGKRMLAKRTAGQAYDLAEEYESVHGDPRSVWGIVQGVTRMSQRTGYADARADLDIAAGKLLSAAVCLN